MATLASINELETVYNIIVQTLKIQKKFDLAENMRKQFDKELKKLKHRYAISQYLGIPINTVTTDMEKMYPYIYENYVQ